MKILHLETGRHLYGGAFQVTLLLGGLREHGIEQVLVCPRGSDIAQAARSMADRVHDIPLRGELDLTMLPRLMGVIRRERPDLVHVHSRRGADLWGGLAARLLGVPAVISRRVDNPEPPWLAALKYRPYRQIITISEGIRQVLLGEGLAPEKVTCVHSAVDTDRYRPGGDRAWLEREFGLEAGQPVIAMLAQFIERKGHRVLLEALPTVFDHHPRTQVLLLGRGPLWEEIHSRVQTRGWSDRVQLPGFRDDLERILPALDLVVHPASLEGLGVALLQAAACGIPIVAGRAGGIPEIVRDGENGFLVAPGDSATLARRINQILDDSTLAYRLGREGRQRVMAHFSVAAMVAGNLAVYRQVLAAHPRKPI